MSVTKVLSDIYNDARDPGSFRSVRDLYLSARNKNDKIKISDVKKFLASQKGYTAHARVRRRFPRDQMISYSFGDLIQCDLANMESLARFNSGIKYILFVVAVLSKRWWVKTAKNKKAKTISDQMEEILKEMPTLPRRCQTDRGELYFYPKEQRVYSVL